MKRLLPTLLLALTLPTALLAQLPDEGVELTPSPLTAESRDSHSEIDSPLPEELPTLDHAMEEPEEKITLWDRFTNWETPNKECRYELRIGTLNDGELSIFNERIERTYGNTPYGQYLSATQTVGPYHNYNSPHIYFSVNNGRYLELGLGAIYSTRARNIYDNTTKEVVSGYKGFCFTLTPHAKWTLIKGRIARFHIGIGSNLYLSKMDGNHTYHPLRLTVDYMFSYGITIGTRLFYFLEEQLSNEAIFVIGGIGYRF